MNTNLREREQGWEWPVPRSVPSSPPYGWDLARTGMTDSAGARTQDLAIKSRVLYQLSYGIENPQF